MSRGRHHAGEQPDAPDQRGAVLDRERGGDQVGADHMNRADGAAHASTTPGGAPFAVNGGGWSQH